MNHRVNHFEIRHWRAFTRRRGRHGVADENAALAGAIAAQIRRGFWLLRFGGDLESAFRDYMRATGQRSRLAMLVIGLMAMLTTLLLDTRLLGLPEAAVPVTRLVMYALQIPSLILACFFVRYWPRSQIAEIATLGSIFAMLLGIMIQRVVDADAGFYLPPELLASTLLAGFTLARIQFWRMLAASLISLVALCVAEALYVTPGPNTHYHLFACSMILTVGLCAGYSMEYFIRWMWLNGTLLRYMARFDGLTGLFNRPALEDAINRSRRLMRRSQRSYALALIDIDGFGDYNNSFGHQAGDAALRRIAQALGTGTVGAEDVCGRYGGEEFVTLWCDVDKATATSRAEAARAAVEALEIATPPHGDRPALTVSIGLCWVDGEASDPPLADVIAAADRKLYRAKSNGRNLVCHAAFGAGRDAARPARDDGLVSADEPAEE